MPTWPDIENPDKFRATPQKAQVKSDFEKGYVGSRAKWTRTRYKFRLSWKLLPESEANTLQDFFDTNLGDAFDWTHPISGTTYQVLFQEDSIDFDFVAPGYWRAEVTLEEQ